ncbi:MAG: CRTAC1 family protein [Planctomycetes bacterium]|nr:CRTAC1 family protein [Planctomycetota bacterium]
MSRAPVLLALALGGLAGCEGDRPTGAARPASSLPAAAPAARPAGPAPWSRVFTDIGQAAGLRFQHVTGGYGKKLLPETLGSGGAFLDFDRDGLLDLFLVNSCYWPGHEPEGARKPACALYRGQGDGTFVDVTAAAGAGISLYGMGCAAADYDGDGDEDIYITAAGDNVLLRNESGRFRDATRDAGLAGGRWTDRQGRSHAEWSTAAAWLDVENDGDLDLFVANYVEWTPELEIFTTLDGVSKAFTTPDRYPGLPCRLFANDGAGKFTDATARAGLEEHKGKGLGLAIWDFDQNGFVDLAVANDTRPNFLFLNQGGLSFKEAGEALEIAYDESGRARAGMGIDIASYANDGVPGVAIGNFSKEPMSLYRWGGSAGFASEAARAGLAQATYEPLAFGVLFADIDLDGALDLVVANGHIEPDIARAFPNLQYAQSPQLFKGVGDGTFAEVGARAGADFNRPRVGRGLAAGDVDGDGDLDLLLTTNGGPPALLRNDAMDGSAGAAPHYLRLRLRGQGKNTAALGAHVFLMAGGVTQSRLVHTGSSYLSQSELAVTFGLGREEKVDRLEVLWPSGEKKTYAVEGVDRLIEIRE